jgi:hypothetical protein
MLERKIPQLTKNGAKRFHIPYVAEMRSKSSLEGKGKDEKTTEATKKIEVEGFSSTARYPSDPE